MLKVVRFFYDIIGMHAIRVHRSLKNKIGHWQCHTRKYHLQKITSRGPTRANKNNNPKGCLLIKRHKSECAACSMDWIFLALRITLAHPLIWQTIEEYFFCHHSGNNQQNASSCFQWESPILRGFRIEVYIGRILNYNTTTHSPWWNVLEIS